MNQSLKKSQPDRKAQKSTYKFSNEVEFDICSDEFTVIALYAFNKGVSMSEAANQISRLALGSDFDTAITEVSTLLDDSWGPDEINSMTQSVMDLSRQYGGSATSQAKALYRIISAGASDSAEAIEMLTRANKKETLAPYEATHKACIDQIKRAKSLMLNGEHTEAQKVLNAVMGALEDVGKAE